MTEIKSIGVVGAGQMGSGIAQVAAQAGLSVTLVDVNQAAIDRGVGRIKKSLDRMQSKGKITEAAVAEILARVKGTTEISQLSEVEFGVEAATENEGLKKKIFADMDKALPEGAILATNTSSISITRLAAGTSRPERVIGMHFMNPVPIMKLVEIIKGLATSELTYQETRTLAEKFGKTTVLSDDQPGFIANRILMPMINEAVFALESGLASPEDIDKTMQLGTNHPMGPLTLADFIGLDTCLAIMEVLHEGLGDSKYRPCPTLRRYVDAGWVGKKCGRGFYKY